MKVITAATLGLAGAGVGAAAMLAGTAGATPTAHTADSAHREISPAMAVAPSDIYDIFELSGDVSSRLGVDGGAGALSACAGESMITDFTGADSGLFHLSHSAPVGMSSRLVVDEQLSETADAPRAARAYAGLLAQEKTCQHEPAGHWEYGATRTLSVTGGKVAWMPITNADGRRGGGVVVAMRDNKVAVTDVTGPASNTSLQALAAQTVNRMH